MPDASDRGKVEDGVNLSINRDGVIREGGGNIGRFGMMEGVASIGGPPAASFLGVNIVPGEGGIKGVDQLLSSGVERCPFGLEPVRGRKPIPNRMPKGKVLCP